MPSPSPRAAAYSPPAQPEFFVQAPVSVVRCPTLPPTAKTTYEVLLSYRDRTGVAYPGQARLAAEVGVAEPTLRRALRLLTAVGLIAPTRRGQGLTNAYRVHRAPLRAAAERKECSVQNEQRVRSRPNKMCAKIDRVESDRDQRDQPLPTPSSMVGEGGGASSPQMQEQIAADAALISHATGMAPDEAQATAEVAAATGHGPGYVAELVAHIESSPSVQNPAGCLRALVQTGRRRPSRGAGGVPPRALRATLHPEHYQSGGKYAHLFNSHRADSTAQLGGPLNSSRVLAMPQSRGPSAFDIALNPQLAGPLGAGPRGQPLSGGS